MYAKNTESNVRPSAVLIEPHTDGRRVTLARNIRAEEREGQTMYVYDEVVFVLPADRAETAEDIERDFDDWWAYATAKPEGEPTIEERLSVVEDMLMELLGGAE